MLENYQKDQSIACKIIINALNNNRLVHAYLIETNGYEKGLSFALDFAKVLLCQNKNGGQPICKNCQQCIMIDNNNFSELKIIQPEGNWIKKEQLSELQEEFNKKSIIGNKKVYIINKAERLNINSSNAILKFLEEPQEGITAILVTNNIYQLLDTIISRCQIISLNGQSEIKEERSTINKLAKILTDNEDEYINMVENILPNEINGLINFIKYYETYKKKVLIYTNQYFFSIFKERESISRAILMLLLFYKDLLNYKVGTEIELYTDYENEIELLAKKNQTKNLIKKISVINDNRQYIDNNANLNLLIDKIIIEMEEGAV